MNVGVDKDDRVVGILSDFQCHELTSFEWLSNREELGNVWVLGVHFIEESEDFLVGVVAVEGETFFGLLEGSLVIEPTEILKLWILVEISWFLPLNVVGEDFVVDVVVLGKLWKGEKSIRLNNELNFGVDQINWVEKFELKFN